MEAVIEVEGKLRDVGEVEQATRLELLRREYQDTNLRVVVFGEFSRGKSTLINALLGQLVLPAKALPTTGHVTRIAWGPRDEVHVRLRCGRVEICSLAQLDSFTTLDFHRRAREDVEAIDVLVDSPLLENGLVFYDTPGVRDVVRAQTERALKAIASADVVLLVLDAMQLLTENEHELAVDWMSRNLGKAVVPVVNWMNIAEERDKEELRCRIECWSREHLGSHLGRPWFEVNAKGALAHILDGSPMPSDDFFALQHALSELVGERRRRLQNTSRHGQLRADITEARRSNDEILRCIREDAEHLNRQREVAKRNLRQMLRRFDVDIRLKRESLTSFATTTLDAKLEHLVRFWFHGEGKEWLEANAIEWYQKLLFEGVAEIEKEAEEALLALAGGGLRLPEPMTIRECLILETRLNVGELKPTGISDGAVATTAWASGFLGQAIVPIPGVGFLAGLLAGAWLAEKLGRQQPDYAAAYSAQARESWTKSAAQVMRLLEDQFDVRAALVKEQLTHRLEQTDSVAAGLDGLAVELVQRESIDASLRRCEELLQTCKEQQ